MTIIPRIHAGRRTRPLLAVALLVCLLLASTAAWPLASAAQSGVTWRGEYYNNVSLSGTPALVRNDSAIDFRWGAGSPGTGVVADGFSVRWTAYAQFAAGSYTFRLTVDDGARLWVDEQLIIDQWHDQSPTAYTVTRNMSAGHHSVRLEYYERAGDAVCQLSWSTGTAITDWRGEYYNSAALSGTPVLVRNDSAINFDWGTGSPANGVSADGFSARWTRSAYFPTTGTYTFSATADDGVRVWVDGALIIDKWTPQARTTHTASKYLGAGHHEIKVEYFEQTGSAVCIVNWALGGSGGGADPSATEVIIDDRDDGFVFGGGDASFYGRSVGYRSRLFWTWNSSSQQYNWGRWYPNLTTSGNWEVYAYVPSRYASTRAATYTILHNGAQDTKIIDQNAHSDQWVSLGTFYFGGGGNEYVALGDATGEGYATRMVAFDAMRFVLRSGSGSVAPPSGCSITPQQGFGRVWSGNATVRARLGCATDVEQQTWAGEQSFQNGYMFWRQDNGKIYVLYTNGSWGVYDDTWSSGEAEQDTSIVPPVGYYQPKRGFGKVWRDQDGVRDGLGWATTDEHPLHASVQRFEHGLMFWSSTRGTLVLYEDNTWQRFD